MINQLIICQNKLNDLINLTDPVHQDPKDLFSEDESEVTGDL